jgi:hypothetical protein
MHDVLTHPYFADRVAAVQNIQPPIDEVLRCEVINPGMWKKIAEWIRNAWGLYKMPFGTLFLALHILKCVFSDELYVKQIKLYQHFAAAALVIAELYVDDFAYRKIDTFRLLSFDPEGKIMNYATFLQLIEKMFFDVGTKLYLRTSWVELMVIINQQLTSEQAEALNPNVLATMLFELETDATPQGLLSTPPGMLRSPLSLAQEVLNRVISKQSDVTINR